MPTTSAVEDRVIPPADCWYTPQWRAGAAVDFVRPDSPGLDSCRLVHASSLHLLDAAGAARLAARVEGSGGRRHAGGVELLTRTAVFGKVAVPAGGVAVVREARSASGGACGDARGRPVRGRPVGGVSRVRSPGS
ncbi:hypothetical protein F3K40_38415 [Streptomyces sp. LBUM 1478]|nr:MULTISPECIES: hypothetical protein [Streptomyces]MBP5871996.1 hypothetical protein [Streptomyces sp. LBUM 1485]MBP5910157.1 hypothetical protein [Streptomyces sp. LBUM 1478]MBP5934463.1 hypothetical protein [Streptomyces sp. LBUM 1479]MBP5911950.1 hypothetical protein [Streptomyces sp. LBUM 1486]MDX2536141.1 hypothetical protein [Streptomyces scabiei]